MKRKTGRARQSEEGNEHFRRRLSKLVNLGHGNQLGASVNASFLCKMFLASSQSGRDRMDLQCIESPS